MYNVRFCVDFLGNCFAHAQRRVDIVALKAAKPRVLKASRGRGGGPSARGGAGSRPNESDTDMSDVDNGTPTATLFPCSHRRHLLLLRLLRSPSLAASHPHLLLAANLILSRILQPQFNALLQTAKVKRLL